MKKAILALTGCLTAAAMAYAAVIVDDDGVGFVGKGDVQLACDWNNSQLQHAEKNGLIKFRISSQSTVETVYDWDCVNVNNQKVQERLRTETITKTTQGLLSSTARVKSQVTGFNLNGFNGAPVVSETTATDGPKLNTCPDKWVLVEGSTTVTTTTSGNGGLELSGDGGATWKALPNTQ